MRLPFRSLSVVLLVALLSWAQAPRPATNVSVNAKLSAPSGICTGTLNGTTALWVSQSGAGAQDGTTQAKARPLSYYGNVLNWGGGGTKIDPGDTVCLTGTITGALTPQGSGSAGNVITIDGTNATLSTGTGASISSKSYLTFDHLTWANGMTDSIDLTSSSNITIQNCHADQTVQGNFVYAAGGGNSNITVKWCFVAQATNSSAFQQDILKAEGGSGFIFEGNDLTLRANSNCAECHDDIVQTYCSGGTPSNISIRYNRMTMDTTQSENKSTLQMECDGGTNYIYGNLFPCIQGAGGGNLNAMYSGVSVTWHVYNNSTYSPNGACQPAWRFLNTSTSTHKNNIIYHATTGTALEISGTVSMTCTFNDIYTPNGAGNDCVGSNNITTNPLYTDIAMLDLTLQSGSPSKGTGTVVSNLGSETFNQGPCTTATWPKPTLCTRNPTTWDRGSFVVTP